MNTLLAVVFLTIGIAIWAVLMAIHPILFGVVLMASFLLPLTFTRKEGE